MSKQMTEAEILDALEREFDLPAAEPTLPTRAEVWAAREAGKDLMAEVGGGVVSTSSTTAEGSLDEAKRSVPRTIGSWALTAVMVACLALASAVVVVPRLIGAVPLTVLTGSMRPTIQPGDLIVSRPVDANDLRIGDVVTFQPVSGDPTLVTHRIVDLTRNLQGETVEVLTRGDANGADDAPLVPEQVMGRMLYRIPRVGYLTNNTGSALQLGMFIGVSLIAYAIITLIRPEKKDADEAKEPRKSCELVQDDTANACQRLDELEPSNV